MQRLQAYECNRRKRVGTTQHLYTANMRNHPDELDRNNRCPINSGTGEFDHSQASAESDRAFISVPFENDFNPQTGIKKGDSYVLQMKPVVPFKLSNDWNLITRTIIPVIQVPDLTSHMSGVTGIGEVSLPLFLPPAKASHIIWGVGPIVSIPTASEDILGTKKLSVGPTAVVLKSQGHWLYGTLVNNVFSVGGPSARADVNQMVMQPFVNYNFRHGWYLTSSPIVTADWEKQRSQRWVVPVGGGVGKIVKIGALPVNMYTQFFSNVERPQGTTNWSARLQIQLLFPKRR